MFTTVYDALGPVYWPMLILWTVTAYLGADLVWRLALGEADDMAAGAALLKRLANSAMIVGLFGQVWSVASSLGSLSDGAAGINGLIKLLSVSLWSTLAGVSVALLAEGLIMVMLCFHKKNGAKAGEVAVCK